MQPILHPRILTALLLLCAFASAHADDKPKTYDEVVTKDAVTQEGLFKVHRIEDKLLFEIPESTLGKEMLWQTEIAQLPQNILGGWPGVPIGTRVVRFVRRSKKVYLRDVHYQLRTEAEGAFRIGVEANSLEPIISAFDVLVDGDWKGQKTSVVDVTSLFTSDPQDFSIREPFPGASVDAGRSYVDKVKAFPKNIETRSVLTVSMPKPIAAGVLDNDAPTSQMTALVHYSLLLLPEKPMMGRLGDSRIGYFSQMFTEVGRPENTAVARKYIDRFRLDKKDPSAVVSEPVQPIVFYLSREVPEKWRPAIRKAIKNWNVAFEQAGFKNAIQARDAPSLREDPDWDPEDARYSVVRWAPSTTQNAMGPSIQDPRSGETLSAHIIVWNNITDLIQRTYFMQASAVDPDARKLPLGDALLSRLLEYVVCHEVGHTLGLEHNFKASNWYTAAQLRDPKFTAEYGLSCSIMDYSRFNYVAQPGDGVKTLIGSIGCYDKFAIEYGYKPIPDAKRPDAEKEALNTILRRQIQDPRLRWANGRVPFDPTVLTEDVGGGDRIESTRLGLLNLDRIARDVLLNATTKFGEDYVRLAVTWIEMFNQRHLELNHVLSLIGGVEETEFHAGDGEANYRQVPAETQRKAARFLLTTGMRKPDALMDGKVWRKICTTGDVGIATGMQRTLLSGMLAYGRTKRMLDNEARYGPKVYTLREYVGDVDGAVWSELSRKSPVVDVFRRSTQRVYLELVDQKINGPAPSFRTDLVPLLKETLRHTARRIDAALPNTTDAMTALHLRESRADIGKILDNKFANHANDAASFSFGEVFGWSAGASDVLKLLPFEMPAELRSEVERILKESKWE